MPLPRLRSGGEGMVADPQRAAPDLGSTKNNQGGAMTQSYPDSG